MINKLKKKLDTVFSRYVRLRDARRTTGGTIYARCITCGQTKEWKRMDAGHWMSRSYGSTRYDERNVHAQCKGCNAFRGGMHEDYRRALIELYGEGVDEELYQKAQESKPFIKSELENLIEEYKEKIKSLDG